jgi:hypothetical protein
MGLLDGFGAGLLGLGGSLLGGLFGQSNQQETNEMQQQMMAQQQSFQERMSSTAYQRASTDMTKAGLNPMMMFGSGAAASSPAGATPSASVKSGGFDGGAIERGLSSAVAQRVANATIDNLVEQNAKIKAEAATEEKRPALVVADTGLRKSQGETEKFKPDVLRGDARVINLRGDILRNEAVTSGNEESMSKDARRILDIGGYGGKRVREIVSPVGEMVSSARRARSLFSDRFHY